MRRADHFLRPAIGHDSVLRAAAAKRVMHDWAAIVGEPLAARSRPDRYDRGTVWVAVEGSAWAQELRMRKELILGRLRELAGDVSLFTDVRFGVRPLPDPPAPEAELPEPEILPHDTGLTIREIAERRRAKRRADPET